jgi:hypothetical protein
VSTRPLIHVADLSRPVRLPIALHGGHRATLDVIAANWPGGKGWPAAVDPAWHSACCVPDGEGGCYVIPTGEP